MDNCGDNRFEIIGKAKQDLLKSTNIDSSKDEMKVLDNFLFRCWQMGWLNQYNLTSDAVGEEILTCEKSKAMQFYPHLLDLVENERMSEHYSKWCDLEREYIALFGENVFADYFGSKCLPDEDVHEDNFTSIEPKPAETKNEGTRQEQCVPKNAESGTHSFNTILKDSFAKERRLNIAAQIVASMVGSDDWTTWRGGTNKEIWHNIAKSSLEIADALIDECEKKGGQDA